MGDVEPLPSISCLQPPRLLPPSMPVDTSGVPTVDTETPSEFEENTNTHSVEQMEWKKVVLPSKNKRKHPDNIVNTNVASINSRDPRIKKTHISDLNTSPLPTSNRFDVLTNANPDTPDVSAENDLKVPPIYLTPDVNFINLCEYFNKTIGSSNYSCVSTRNKVKIMPATPTAYRSLVKLLRENKASFHTYQLPADRPYRVVIRGLHPSIGADVVKRELLDIGFEVCAVSNVLARDKVPLPLFYIDLLRNKKSEEIFSLQHLFQTKITVEEPHKRKDPVQCHNCQSYGHTKNYCALPPRCVKCGQEHLSINCTKTKTLPARCALCQKNHPSNWKGCNVYQELKHLRSPKSASNKSSVRVETQLSQTKLSDVSQFPDLRPTDSNNLYDVPSSSTSRRSGINTGNNRSYAHVLSPPQNVNSPGQFDLSTQLTSFLSEMKSLITPIISLMSQLMQILVARDGK